MEGLQDKIALIADEKALEVIREIQAENKKLAADNEIAEGIIGDQSKKIASLEKQLKEQPVNQVSTGKVIELPTVKVDEVEYKFSKATFRIIGDAKKYTAQEASNNQELVEKIIAIEGQTILVKQ